MNGTYDVIVIGGGIAGTAAALSASAAGARTALIAARPGATALCSGAWRGSLPSDLARALARAGYHVAPAPLPLPWLDGTRRTVDECHDVHAIEWDTRALICGIAGLPAFHAAVLADCWRTHMPATELSAVRIELPGTPAAGWAPAALARFVELDPERFCETVAPHVQQARANVLVLPALLGVHAPEATHNAVEARLGVRVFEIAGGSPPLPGWRLQQALRACVADAGVAVIEGTATGCAREGRRAASVTVAGSGGEERLAARSFVLATGKFVGGGISANGTFREAVFELPVWVDHLGERFERVEPLALTNAARNARQPLMFAGVSTDEVGRPVDARDAIVLENVFVAGAVRAGVDGSAMNLGHMATDGWAAGARAAA